MARRISRLLLFDLEMICLTLITMFSGRQTANGGKVRSCNPLYLSIMLSPPPPPHPLKRCSILRLINNYSTSARWIWVGYNHLISNKREWNNCFVKNAAVITRIGKFLSLLCPIILPPEIPRDIDLGPVNDGLDVNTNFSVTLSPVILCMLTPVVSNYAVWWGFCATDCRRRIYSCRSLQSSQVPPEIPSMNLLFESWISW